MIQLGIILVGGGVLFAFGNFFAWFVTDSDDDRAFIGRHIGAMGVAFIGILLVALGLLTHYEVI